MGVGVRSEVGGDVRWARRPVEIGPCLGGEDYKLATPGTEG